MSNTDVKRPPVSEVVEIDREIGEVARRLSSGVNDRNDFSTLNELVRRRAGLMLPPSFETVKLAADN